MLVSDGMSEVVVTVGPGHSLREESAAMHFRFPYFLNGTLGQLTRIQIREMRVSRQLGATGVSRPISVD